MSNLPGNYYMERLIDSTMPKTPESLATLALAYEQRTANLIALHQMAVNAIMGGADPGISSDDLDRNARDIESRLELGGNK